MKQENNVTMLEEKIPHGTPQLPFSIHYSEVSAGTANVLYKHWHQEFEFLVVIDGGTNFYLDDNKYELLANEGVFIPPNTLHYATSLQGLPCIFYAFVFHPSFLSDNYKSSLYLSFIKPVLSGRLTFLSHFGSGAAWEKKGFSILMSLADFYQKPLDSHELELKGRIYELWALFTKHASLVQNEGTFLSLHSSKSNLDAALLYMHEHFTDDISLNILAECVCLSASQFCRSFKAQMGLSPFSYLIRYRILKSCALITDSNEKIAAIASLVGFNNVSYFNRSFKSVIGCTPTEYRTNKETYITLQTHRSMHRMP